MEGQSLYISGYDQECENQQHQKLSSEQFTVESFLDYPNEDDMVINETFFDGVNTTTGGGSGSGSGNSTDSSNFTTTVDSCTTSVCGNANNFHGNFSDSHFSGDIGVPYEDVAELEWLSNFVGEDSNCSNEDQYHNLHLISGSSSSQQSAFDSSFQLTQFQNISPASPHNSSIVPAKAQRSRRTRIAPCDWSSRLHLIAPPAPTNNMPSNMDSGTKHKVPTSYKKRDGNLENSEGRRCLHCASEKTPQWRTGPMGPKTLCNACGVRYKSGRLVPEYRPAASPTFVSTKHSNSHRKVLELRKQREGHGMGGHQHHNYTYIDHHPAMYGVSDVGDYLIHHPMGLDYGHMI